MQPAVDERPPGGARRRPAQRRLGWSIPLAVVVLLALQTPLVTVGVVPLDEGQLVNIASRLLSGEVLYRDIYTGIMPASYYLAALVMGLAGGDLLATRWLEALLNALTFVALWRLGSYVMRPFWAAIAPLWFVVLAVVSFPVYTMYAYSSLGLVAALLAVWAWMEHLESGRIGPALASSAALALCTLTKQNYGVFVGVACLIGWLARQPWRTSAGPRLSRSMLWLVGPAAGVGALTLLAFAAAGALWPLLEATVVTIFGAQLSAFDQPMPPVFGEHARDGLFVFLYTPGTLFHYLLSGDTLLGVPMSASVRSAVIRAGYGTAQAAVYLSVPLVALTAAVRGRRAAARAALIAAFAATFFLGMFPSAVWSHLAAVLPPLVLIVAMLADVLEGDRPWLRVSLRVPVAIVTAVALVATVSMVRDLRRWNDVPFGFENASLRVSAQRKALFAPAVQFLQDCASPGEPVFVAPDMPLLYFLADRPNPTPYDLIIPGDVRDDRIVEILARREVRCAVWNPRMYPQFGAFEEIFPKTWEYLSSRFEVDHVVRSGQEEWRCLRRP